MSAIERTTPAGLPPGWRREVVVRKSGQSAGKYDVYYFSPDGKKFRSKPQIVRYLGESVDLNLFDFSGRSTVGGQRRTAKDRPSKKEMHLGRLQERPLSNTPMRPAGPIRRTCGVIKLPVMYYPLRPATSAAQIVTAPDPQVVLGSVVQQLWARRLSPLHPVDSISGKQISADSPPPPQENNSVVAAGSSEQPNLVMQLSPNLSQTPPANTKLTTGVNSIKSPPINPQYNSSVQNSNLRMTATQQPPSLPNHYTASVHTDSTAAVSMKSHTNSNIVPVTSLPIQPTSNNSTVLPLYSGPPAPQPVVAAGHGAPTQGFIPIQQNGQGLLFQPNNVVYMQLPQGTNKGGSSNLISNSNKAAASLQIVQQQLPHAVPQQAINHSFITETDIRLQEQKVKLLRQQLGLTS